MNLRTTTVLTASILAATLVPASAAHAAPAEQRSAAPRTALTFTVDDCEGCEVQLVSALLPHDADSQVKVWSSKARKVKDGKVTFDVATKRTWGMSVNVRAPWEGQTGYVTNVAWRYNGMRQGDTVTLEEAVTKKKASACWEGVRRSKVTVPLVVEEVEVDGVHGRVPGSIAFVPETQLWLKPMREVVDGVLGSQDVNVCR